MNIDGSDEQVLTGGPVRRGAELGAERPRHRVPAQPAAAAAGALPHLARGRRAAADRDSAGCVRPRLVGTDGLMTMRKASPRRCHAARIAAAVAQLRLPHIIQRGGPAQRGPVAAPLLRESMRLRAEFRWRGPAAPTSISELAAQCLERRPGRRSPRRRSGCSRHPEVVVRVEGYGDPLDTRDHALALGAAPRRGGARLSGAAWRAGRAARATPASARSAPAPAAR